MPNLTAAVLATLLPLSQLPPLPPIHRSPLTVHQRYTHGPRLDEVLRTDRGTAKDYRLDDALGSVTEVLSSAGDLVERYTYEAFGLPTILAPDDTVRLTSAIGNRFLFTGREWDATPELYHYRARYYEPWIGRFYARDPLGQWPDVNLYRYVHNNPVNYVDPFGAIAGVDDATVLIILGGVALVTAAYLLARSQYPHIVQGGPGSWENPLPVRGMEDLLDKIGRGGPFLKSPKNQFWFALSIVAGIAVWVKETFFNDEDGVKEDIEPPSRDGVCDVLPAAP